tara:strand:- start:376 stop:870 length:495 start_codon:yes stop_codon:yes gene_type:complete
MKALRIGIDPGRNGGIAARMEDDTIRLVSFSKFFENSVHQGACQLYAELGELGVNPKTQVYMEFIAGYINGARPSPKGMFTFGSMYGAVIGIIAGYVPIENITVLTPQHWQRLVGAPEKSSVAEGKWKRALQDMAKERFPKVRNITQAVSDALLILDAGERFSA